ncbi:MAG TPA: phosphate ABC transporter permease PstA [Candidatus Angelobacter sp.]|nr:phosphate ABC transporter permease PstA [Candidatus Angelobacter sp.]
MPKTPSHKIHWRRRLVNALAVAAVSLAALVVMAPLVMILGTVIVRGMGGLHWSFFTQIPKGPGEAGGGMANAIGGSGLILLVASTIGIPLGVGAGIFLAEYGRNFYGNIVRFTSDVLNGIPSIVIGVTAYALLVLKTGHYSPLAGGVALGIMMIPTVCRTTEEVLLMVPQSIREAALGLGIPQWRTTVSVVVRTATAGIVTSIMLAFARVAGETAPLLFTVLGSAYWNWKLTEPTAAMPLQIYQYSITAYDEWIQQAWTGAMVLIAMIIGTVILVRSVTNRGMLKGTS